MRLFAALYAAAALLAGFARGDQYDAVPWVLVCVTATGLALAAVARRPLVMLSAGHAGLTATWAGTLAARYFHSAHDAMPTAPALTMLVMMCAGMAVLITLGLLSAPREAAQKSPRR